MFWKRAFLIGSLALTLALSACHKVSEDESQIMIAKPAKQIVAQIEGKVQQISPSIALPHSMTKSGLFMPVPKYIPQPNNPAYTANFAHPDTQCSWIGVAGQVFDLKQNPQTSVVVQLKGTMNGTPITELGMSGTATIYGPSGYEILLGSQPFDSKNQLTVQLLDSKGKPLSGAIPINTYKDCQKNLILVNFMAVDFKYQYALPVISQGASAGSN